MSTSVCPHVCASLTSLDAGVVDQLVVGGALTPQLAAGQGGGGDSVGADTGVAVPRLGEAEEAAGQVHTRIMSWGGGKQAGREEKGLGSEEHMSELQSR